METKQNNEKNVLLKRFLLSTVILLFIQIGTFLPVPDINLGHLAFYIQRHPITQNFVGKFAGSDTFIIGLFTLNIFPYINASIILQVLTTLIPNLSKLQKEGGAEGKRKINRLTRLITLGWAIIQSASIAFYLKRALFDWNLFLAGEIIIWLTTGAIIVLWLSELITEYGLGNGASLLIYTNIVSNLPNLSKRLITENSGNLTAITWFIIILMFLMVVYGIVFLQESTRIIPLISSKQLNQSPLQYLAPVKDNYIPLRFNQAGVMPIILATSILIIPNYLGNTGLLGPLITSPLIAKFSKIIYWVSYFVLILLFTSFYSTIVLNPKDISDQLQNMAVSIPGKRPGVETTFYLKQVTNRITFLGGIILGILAILPNVLETVLDISSFSGLGISSLLILVGVISDLSREIRSIVLTGVYNDMFNETN